ncbi:Bug family tripartite tricarboxylate transporter substrate binding protein [Verminephrobacter eiseniae]|uniref:Uncharacterized protein UPF0065 n=1 Tax=Verminephrobacter eiseniae (strain EF01-2) TaxID=391735 RepID=A1WEY7_VEREI|nr:tripartite tricarboxylate transporter substrate binding protein [Verminephrobacter eiseniae]ABM56194.1 Uncharacterized protein UPF0065 [Verminephrobacter eiseniae EF01-2]MCW5286565.1 tripartite tricarboxylate transporter substrate binding protein [Verminephrobacter eiseniae]MCW5304864.1 tripartite tricarboxylate transporter substrate binding protein [Verminephrobacter eiseniae]MCW8178304.1 tripartite tricarboxylate transporter substrate binding protein [Verminephrobacter eiseniae]MCW8190034
MNRREMLLATTPLALGARAGTFPDKPIRYICPVAAGGGSDMIARVFSQRWGQLLGQPFVVDNQSGGGGVVACQSTAHAKPDGYTLMQGYVATHGTVPATRTVAYDPIGDFTPIGMIGATPNVLAVTSSLPVDTLAQFVEYARKHPRQINYGSAGSGSLTHLAMELFIQASGASMLHVPYRGIAPAFNDLLGGQIQAMFPGLAATLPYLRAHRVKVLALTGNRRSPLLKGVPTLDEAGFKGFVAAQWYGALGPAQMPADIVARLNQTQVAALNDPALREKLVSCHRSDVVGCAQPSERSARRIAQPIPSVWASDATPRCAPMASADRQMTGDATLALEAVEPMPMTATAFGQYIAAEVQRWSALAKARNIRFDM